MADFINIPNKVPTSLLEADEFNQVPAAINAVGRAATESSHVLFEDHFVEDGTAVPPGEVLPKPIIKLKLNPAHFEIVNGMISIKASLLA